MQLNSDMDKGTFFFVVVCIVIFFLILAFALIFFVLLHQKKNVQHAAEKKLLHMQFQKSLLQTQLEMQEQTFDAISKEIHDNVGQVLSLAKVQLNLIDQSSTLNKNQIAEVKESVGKAIADLRDIAKSLNTDRIQTCDLKELVEAELNRIRQTGLYQTYLYERGASRQLPPQKKLILLRIIQESLQNVMKHAQANSVIVILKYEDAHLEVFIYDNGKGFDAALLNGKDKGLGFHNMMNRTKLIEGTAEIESIPGNGTSIKLIIPYA